MTQAIISLGQVDTKLPGDWHLVVIIISTHAKLIWVLQYQSARILLSLAWHWWLPAFLLQHSCELMYVGSSVCLLSQMSDAASSRWWCRAPIPPEILQNMRMCARDRLTWPVHKERCALCICARTGRPTTASIGCHRRAGWGRQHRDWQQYGRVELKPWERYSMQWRSGLEWFVKYGLLWH